MPALLVDTNARPASSSDASVASAHSGTRSKSPTPDRPPVSPLTPTASVAQLAPVERTEPRPRPAPPPTATFRPQPPAVAISESDNPDAIALRSAISILQLQREKSKRDLKALDELKAAAVANPEAFVRSLQDQRAQASQSYQDVLTPTLAGLTDPVRTDEERPSSADARKDSTKEAKPEPPKFPPIPQPQNIVRCPPINWDKYHVVGESLDKMHEEQKKWPGSSEPPRTKSGQRAPPHSVTAPYSPFTDGISARSSSATTTTTTTTTTTQPPKNPKKPPS